MGRLSPITTTTATSRPLRLPLSKAWRYLPALGLGVLAACGGAIAAGSSVAATRAAPILVQRNCPPTDLLVRKSTRRGVRRELVPPGPRSVLLCRYGAYGSSGGRLLGQRPVYSAAIVRELMREFDTLPKIPAGTTACPADNGAAIISYFHYAKGDDVPVDLHTSGCAYATNGYIKRDAMKAPGPRLIRQLEGLTSKNRPLRSPALAG